jgi:hypothetical protein
MRDYVESLSRAPSAGRQSELLDRIIARPPLHARLLNTLARLEYVGVRKMLKSRRAERLDLAGLEHMLDEAVHALRLKKAALAVDAGLHAVRTFAAEDTLAGEAGERYFQAVDRAAELELGDLPEGARAEVNYLLTSAAIEVRAQSFYPLYEGRLRAQGAGFSLAAIMKDEDEHLAQMTARLEAALPGWRARLGRVLEEEDRCFQDFLGALEGAISAVLPAAEARAAGA